MGVFYSTFHCSSLRRVAQTCWSILVSQTGIVPQNFFVRPSQGQEVDDELHAQTRLLYDRLFHSYLWIETDRSYQVIFGLRQKKALAMSDEE